MVSGRRLAYNLCIGRHPAQLTSSCPVRLQEVKLPLCLLVLGLGPTEFSF